MCRDFLPDPLDAAVVDRVIDRARRAPSAGHTQGWAWVVLEGDDRRQFWEGGGENAALVPNIARAPVLVLPVVSPAAYAARYREADKGARGWGETGAWPVPYWWVDAGAAVGYLLLAAADEGLGALFFALHGPARPLLDRLGVPDGWEVVGAIALGHPAPGWRQRRGASAARGRPPLDEVIHRGHWRPGGAGSR